jgi:uncharacterized OB-fold protein
MRRGARYVEAHRCPEGCIWMHRHERCPRCGGPLRRTRVPNEAVLVSHTIIRVNPTGTPIELGLAVTRCGAATLCIVEGKIRGNGRDRVRLVFEDGRFHALARQSRLPKPER